MLEGMGAFPVLRGCVQSCYTYEALFLTTKLVKSTLKFQICEHYRNEVRDPQLGFNIDQHLQQIYHMRIFIQAMVRMIIQELNQNDHSYTTNTFHISYNISL